LVENSSAKYVIIYVTVSTALIRIPVLEACSCRGTLGIHNMTVGDGCQLFLGPTGTTRQTNYVSEAGIYTFEGLTVAAGGEVTHIPGAPTDERNLTIVVR